MSLRSPTTRSIFEEGGVLSFSNGRGEPFTACVHPLPQFKKIGGREYYFIVPRWIKIGCYPSESDTARSYCVLFDPFTGLYPRRLIRE